MDALEEESLLGTDLKRASAAIRRGFVQKVYGILTAQLAMTVLIAAEVVLLAAASGDVASWILSHEWLLVVSVLGTFSVMCVMLCCREQMRRYPTNYVFLFTFTAFEALAIGLVSAMFTPESLLLAAGVTTLIFVALTAYAFNSSTDFTGAGPYLFAGFFTLFLFGIILGLLPLIGVSVTVSTMIWDCLGALVLKQPLTSASGG